LEGKQAQVPKTTDVLFSSSPKAGWHLNWKLIRHKKFSLNFWSIITFALVTSLIDWMGPVHIKQGNLLYSISQFKYSLIRKHPNGHTTETNIFKHLRIWWLSQVDTWNKWSYSFKFWNLINTKYIKPISESLRIHVPICLPYYWSLLRAPINSFSFCNDICVCKGFYSKFFLVIQALPRKCHWEVTNILFEQIY
jgi:hypothetical protein